MNATCNRITVTRTQDQDAAQLAAQTAKEHGTKLATSIRWYGGMGPAYREVDTADGRTIRVEEPVAT